MENSLVQIYDNPEFGKIRTVVIDGVPYFVGKDVATALGYKDTKAAVRDHATQRQKVVDFNNSGVNRPP